MERVREGIGARPVFVFPDAAESVLAEALRDAPKCDDMLS